MEQENNIQDLPGTTSLVRKVFKSTWAEFYAWEQSHCLHTLRSLSQSPAVPSSVECATDDTQTPPQNDGDETFTILEYLDGSGPSKTANVSAEVIGVLPALEPYPQYESCAPVRRNIMHGDDSDHMPFIPLADDPTFDIVEHTEEYRYFEWQTADCDPDCESKYPTVHPYYPSHFCQFLSGSHCYGSSTQASR